MLRMPGAPLTPRCEADPLCAAGTPGVTLGGIPETWTGGIAAGDHHPPGGGAHPPPAAGTAACAHLRRRAATALPGLHCCGQLCVHHSSEVDLSCSSAVETLLAYSLLSRRVRDATPHTNARPARQTALHRVVSSISRPSSAALLIQVCFLPAPFWPCCAALGAGLPHPCLSLPSGMNTHAACA